MQTRTGNIKIKNGEKILFTRKRERITSLMLDSIKTLDPSKLTENALTGFIKENEKFSHIYVIGFGKASISMYDGIHEIVKNKSSYSGVIIPDNLPHNTAYSDLDVLKGTHPIVSDKSEKSTKLLLENIKNHGSEDLVIVLISGGGSALFEIPEERFTIPDMANISRCLMDKGADIQELNIVRNLMSKVKGGKLAGILAPSTVLGLIVSDVPGDDLQFIASGPLTRKSYGNNEVLGVLNKFRDVCQLPKDLDTTGSKQLPDTVFSNVRTELVLKNRDFVKHISEQLSSDWTTVHTIAEPITGDVHEAAVFLAEKARQLYSGTDKQLWIVGGGETTAQVKGNGIGGRNCELSIRLSLLMEKNEDFAFASFGSDGKDGGSPAMGGITDTWFRQNAPEEEVNLALSTSDSFSLLEKYNSAVITGYTGTNVSDIFILYYNGLKNEEEY